MPPKKKNGGGANAAAAVAAPIKPTNGSTASTVSTGKTSNGTQHSYNSIDDDSTTADSLEKGEAHNTTTTTEQTALLSSSSTTNGKLSPRSAFRAKDAEASKKAHAARRLSSNKTSPTHNDDSGEPQEAFGASHLDGESPIASDDEPHGGQAAEHIKSIVYGGLDGIITTFATVTSVAGAELSASVIVVLGISHLFADGLSMGMGDAMSSQAELDYNLSERRREAWECDNNLEGEIQEMLDLYEAKGVSPQDAKTIITTLAKYRKPFLDHMMVEELGLMPADENESVWAPALSGAVTMASFIFFGSVPLLPYLIALIPGLGFSAQLQLISSITATVITLFALGAIKGAAVEFGAKAWWYSGMLMACNGSFAAGIGYVLGVVLGKLVSADEALAAAAG